MNLFQKISKYYLSHKTIQVFVRYCIVGAICTGIDAAIYYLFLTFAPYQLALASGYLISLVANYFLTIYWTFQVQPNAGNAICVVAAHIFNLFVVRMGLMYLFVEVLGLSDRVAYLPTLVISVVTNFIILKIVIKKFS